jgi:hypothetical protein
MSEQEQAQVLRELDVPPSAQELQARADPRIRYAVREGLVLQVAGHAVRFLVRARDISCGGISVLHGAFVYPGTECVVTLRTRDGEFVRAGGRILRCRCVRGRVHEVGIVFTDRIDVENFVTLAARTESDAVAAAEIDRAAVGAAIRELAQLLSAQAPQSDLASAAARLTGLVGGRVAG